MVTNHDILKDIKQAVLSVDESAEVILFGSRARGDYSDESDWDVLVLTDQEQNDWKHRKLIMNVVFDVELHRKQIITPIIRNKMFWKELEITPLYQEIDKDGVVL